MLRIGRKGKIGLKFFEIDKLGDLSFIDENPNGIYFLDISKILISLPMYKTNLIKKLKSYQNIYNIKFKEYKNWIIVGDVKFVFPEIKIIR